MGMVRVRFTFPPRLIKEPIISDLGKKFDVTSSIRRADVSEEQGWVILELDGNDDEIERAIAWVESKGVRVDPAIGDVVE